MTGILCLVKFNQIFNTEKAPQSQFFEDEEGIECSCLPECSRIQYSITMGPIYDEPAIGDYDVKIDIHYKSKSMLKYRTDVTFGWIDLVVGFGGILGLFFGFSLLSGAEIIYFCTIRLYYQYKKARKEKSKAEFPFTN